MNIYTFQNLIIFSCFMFSVFLRLKLDYKKLARYSSFIKNFQSTYHHSRIYTIAQKLFISECLSHCISLAQTNSCFNCFWYAFYLMTVSIVTCSKPETIISQCYIIFKKLFKLTINSFKISYCVYYCILYTLCVFRLFNGPSKISTWFQHFHHQD